MSLRSRIRGGQDYLTVNGATAAQFLTLRLSPLGSTHMGCDDSDGPGHAPRYLDVSITIMTVYFSAALIHALYLSFFGVMAMIIGVHSIFIVDDESNPLWYFTSGIILVLLGYIYWRRSRVTILLSGCSSALCISLILTLITVGVSEWMLEVEFVVMVTILLLIVTAINTGLMIYGWKNFRSIKWW